MNKFTHERIQYGPRRWQVDAELVAWLRARHISDEDHAKSYAKKILQKSGAYLVPQPHDAGYDAAASLAAFEYLVKFLTPKQRWEHPEAEG